MVHIGIGGIPRLTDASFKSIGKHCTKLYDLNAHQLPQVTADGMQQLMLMCPRLKYLDVSGCSAGLCSLPKVMLMTEIRCDEEWAEAKHS